MDIEFEKCIDGCKKYENDFECEECLQGYYVSIENAQKGLQSENTDGYSVTYISGNQITELISAKIDVLQDLISEYLFGIIINNEHILYCGV